MRGGFERLRDGAGLRICGYGAVAGRDLIFELTDIMAKY